MIKNNVVYAVIAAAGSGSRAKLNKNKLFAEIDGTPVLSKTVSVFDTCRMIDEIVIIYRNGELETVKNILSFATKPIKFVEGGNTRFESVKNALNSLDNGIVLIHDGARPYIYKETIEQCVLSVLKHRSGVVGAPLTETVLDTDGKGNIISSLRVNRYSAKTPQAFYVDEIKKAYSLCVNPEKFTDDAGVYCNYIGKCKLVESNEPNPKLTYPEDFSNSATFDYKVGTGFDLHRLTENRKLILGGIEIKHDKGLLGHSDADVLTHAIMDALLSALSLRDIGYHFSDKSPEFKDISSMVLLERVMQMITEKGYKVNNVSAVIMAEKPKMASYVEQITNNLATALNISPSNLGITLTTLEGIGIVGREEGIAVQAYCSLTKIKE